MHFAVFEDSMVVPTGFLVRVWLLSHGTALAAKHLPSCIPFDLAYKLGFEDVPAPGGGGTPWLCEATRLWDAVCQGCAMPCSIGSAIFFTKACSISSTCRVHVHLSLERVVQLLQCTLTTIGSRASGASWPSRCDKRDTASQIAKKSI